MAFCCFGSAWPGLGRDLPTCPVHPGGRESKALRGSLILSYEIVAYSPVNLEAFREEPSLVTVRMTVGVASDLPHDLRSKQKDFLKAFA